MSISSAFSTLEDLLCECSEEVFISVVNDFKRSVNNEMEEYSVSLSEYLSSQNKIYTTHNATLEKNGEIDIEYLKKRQFEIVTITDGVSTLVLDGNHRFNSHYLINSNDEVRVTEIPVNEIPRDILNYLVV